MYEKFSILMRWKWEEIAFSRSEIGGFKEAQALIRGDNVFRRLKYESGVHRVQRIPVNDTKIQTSAASVIILPEAEELDVEIRPQDLKIDVFRAGGAGGQHVNKTESAVRMTHIPTGIVISMQDERSQKQNKERALKYLRARVYDLERKRFSQSRNELRTAAQGTGDRSDKIRTYNFPQDRVSDHRIGLTVSGVQRVLAGEDLSVLLDALIESDEKERLVKFMESLEANASKYTGT
jgi:peptide chain release factor 1